MKATVKAETEAGSLSLYFRDEDVVNLDDYIPAGECNPNNIRPWLLHDHGFTIAVVFADCLQGAIDEAVDADKMNRYLISKEDYDDYRVNSEQPTCSFLGNACESFDIESLGYIEMSSPLFSFAALFQAQNDAKKTALSAHFA